MLQIATPYANDEDIEGSLDTWVKNICKKYDQSNVEWLRIPSEDEAQGEQTGESSESSGSSGSGKSFNEKDYDIPAIKKLLMENGMPESLLDILPPADLVENARGLGLLEEKKPPEE